MEDSIANYFEAAIYSLVNYIPYLCLAIYPFRKKLRFNKWINIIALTLLTICQIVFEILALIVFPQYPYFFTILDTVIFIASYFLFIREKPGKLVFTFIMLANFSNYILVASTYLRSVVCWNTAISDGWEASLITAAVQLVVLLPLAVYFKKYYTAAINACYEAAWDYLWVLPTTFYIIWHFILYHVSDCSSYEMALRRSTTVFLSLTTLGFCVIYHIAIMLITTRQEQLKLEQEKRLWEMTSLQYRTINERITESRIVRHDLRHQVMILQSLLANQQYRELQEQLERYGKKLTYDTSCVFCENDTANIIIGFFAQQAKKQGITFHANVCFPNSVALDRLEVGVLLANLLENAIDACKVSTAPEKLISLCIKTQGDSVLVLSIQNTSNRNPLEPSGEFFHSTKHDGVGLGLTSVRRIVERHNGKLNIKQADFLFSVSFVLYLD